MNFLNIIWSHLSSPENDARGNLKLAQKLSNKSRQKEIVYNNPLLWFPEEVTGKHSKRMKTQGGSFVSCLL